MTLPNSGDGSVRSIGNDLTTKYNLAGSRPEMETTAEVVARANSKRPSPELLADLPLHAAEFGAED